MALIQHPDVKRMLLAQKTYAEGALSLVLLCAKLIDEEKWAPGLQIHLEASALLGLLTPVAKTWPSEWGPPANDLAIQIHGGYGQIRDFDVEQLFRDNRLNSIHEGTTGIQAIDLLGRKIIKDEGAALNLLRLRVAQTAAVAIAQPDLKGFGEDLINVWDDIAEVAWALTNSVFPSIALSIATAFQSAFGHAVIAWLWLDQANCTRGVKRAPDPFLAGKIRACGYFFESEVPKIATWLAPVRAMSQIASAMAEDEF